MLNKRTLENRKEPTSGEKVDLILNEKLCAFENSVEQEKEEVIKVKVCIHICIFLWQQRSNIFFFPRNECDSVVCCDFAICSALTFRSDGSRSRSDPSRRKRKGNRKCKFDSPRTCSARSPRGTFGVALRLFSAARIGVRCHANVLNLFYDTISPYNFSHSSSYIIFLTSHFAQNVRRTR